MNWEIKIKGKPKAVMETDIDKHVFLHIYAVTRGLKSIAIFPLQKNEIEIIGELANLLALDADYYKCSSGYDMYVGHRDILYLLNKLFDTFKINSVKYHRAMGFLCNIPDCCINNFMKHEDQVVMLDDYLKQLNGKKDPYALSLNKDKYILKDKIPFIPCSPDCKLTKKLYDAYNQLWDELDKKYGVP